MIVLTQEEFNAGAVVCSSQIVYQNKVFNRGPDFSRKRPLYALQYCHQNSDKDFLLVDNSSYISVWSEDNYYSTSIAYSEDCQKAEELQVEENITAIVHCPSDEVRLPVKVETSSKLAIHPTRFGLLKCSDKLSFPESKLHLTQICTTFLTLFLLL